jgi:lactate 2-monooxygenase
MLKEVGPVRDYSREIFGRKLPAPIVMAPVGVQTLFHPDGEKATAKVFGELGLPYTLSTASSNGFKTVAEANGKDNPKWYQLYWLSDDELTASYLRSAQANGYEVLVVTLDTWELSWRPKDLTSGYFPFVRGIGAQLGLEDEVAHKKLGFDPLAPGATKEQKEMAAMYRVLIASGGTSPTWPKLKLLRELWGDKPIVLKGIQCVKDAELAIEHGMNGIIVSNVSHRTAS